MYSNNGYLLPPEGGYRVLVVYAQVDYSVGGCPNPGDTYETNGEWPTGGAPYWETGGGPYLTSKPLFDVDYITYGSGTLSDYYFQASLGENFLLGDYYSILDCRLKTMLCSIMHKPPYSKNSFSENPAHFRYKHHGQDHLPFCRWGLSKKQLDFDQKFLFEWRFVNRP